MHRPSFSSLSYDVIQDLKDIPQSAELVQSIELASDSMSVAFRKKEFNKNFFSIWHRKKIETTRAEYMPQSLAAKSCYGENLQPRPAAWLSQQLENANLSQLQSLNVRGIMLHTADIRMLPTLLPCFLSPLQAGEGYPFDYLQTSQLYAGSPVLISHYSSNRAWVFVETNTELRGWVLASTVGLLDAKQIAFLERRNLAVLVEDGVPLYLNQSRYLEETKVGMILLLSQSFPHTVLFPVLNAERVEFKNVRINPAVMLDQPLVFDRLGISFAVSRFIGKPYSWGNQFGNRDCSGMTKDFYALFHILLPPFSGDQIKYGQLLSLQGDPSQKMQLIKKQAKPFQSLLYRRGHIGIYAGIWNNRPLLFHAAWGIRTKEGQHEGRDLIAKVVFTSLEPGRELSYFDPEKGNALKFFDHLVNLTEDPFY